MQQTDNDQSKDQPHVQGETIHVGDINNRQDLHITASNAAQEFPDLKPTETSGEQSEVHSYIGGDSITVGDISNSKAIAIGHGAEATVIINLPKPRPDAVDNLRPLNPNFTGRQEVLATITKTFASTVSPIVMTQAISGMGGVGKTQVALAYAHTHRDKYDVIWLLQANDTIALDNSLRQLGERLELAVAGKDMETMRHIVLSYLGSSRKNTLLLYDNADQITPHDLFPYLPSGCHILIISRRKATQWSEIAKAMTLGVWTEAEAALFWQRRLGRELTAIEEVALAELADELGFLPLAMEQAAALLGNDKPSMSVTAYIEEFKVERELLRGKGTSPIYYHDGLTVATTWTLAFNRAKKTAGAADLLNLCSFFAPDDIPLATIREHTDSLPTTLATVLADEDKRENALAALSDYSLLTVTNGMLNIHQLVQAVARERMGDDGVWMAVAMNVLSKAYNFDQYDMSTWTQCDQLLPHVITTVNLATKWGNNSVQASYLNGEAGIYLNYYGNYTEALPFFERNLAINEEQLGSNHPVTGTSLNNLGTLLKAMGEYGEARVFFERALAIREKQLGSDHSDTATSLNNLGGLLKAIGEYEEALPFYERALAIREKQFSSDHPDIAQSLNNLGTLLHVMGEYRDARPFYERALAIREKQLGSDHPDIAQSLNNLGGLLESIGEYGEARPFYERALVIFEKQLDSDPSNIATLNNNLGALLESIGEYGEARPFYERALVIFEKQLGSDHPNIATLNNNLGHLLQAMEEYGEARLFYERALVIFEKQLGSDHPNIATLNNNLGALLQALGEYREAQLFYERALAIREKQLGSDHPDIAQSLNNLGSLLQAMGEYGEARLFYERALAISEKQLGSDHPSTAYDYNNLAILSYHEGDMQTAAQLMRRALVIFEKVLGDNHPNTQQVRGTLTAIEAKSGRRRWQFWK